MKDVRAVLIIDTVDEDALVASIKGRLGVKVLVAVTMNFQDDDIDGYNKLVSALAGLDFYTFTPKKLDII